ncbi:VOC family protein [bacterium]|nr:VOC family protein [bacterium]
MSIHHLAIQTSNNLETLKDFYQNVLELPLFQIQKAPDDKVRAYWFELNPGVLMLEINPDMPKVARGRHIVIFNTTPEERKDLEEKLQKKNVVITNRTDFTFYFKDPDGNTLGFSHYPHK